MYHSSAAQMREEVRTRIESLARGGLLLCWAYDLDFIPGGNVTVFVEAVRAFGYRPLRRSSENESAQTTHRRRPHKSPRPFAAHASGDKLVGSRCFCW